MDGVVSGREFLALFSKVILGHGSLQTQLVDYFKGAVGDLLGALYPGSGFINCAVTLGNTGATGVRRLTVGAGTKRFVVEGKFGTFTNATLGCNNIPFDESADQWVLFDVADYPTFTDIGTDGTIAFKHLMTAIGARYTPSAVAVAGAGLKITVSGIPTWTDGAATRSVKVWKVAPVTGSSEAIYSGLLVKDGSDLVVNVPHKFGQSSPSTTFADYVVFVHGPVVTGSDPASWTWLAPAGKATYVAPATPPTFDYGLQRRVNVLSPSVLDAASLLFPVRADDSADAAKRWNFLFTAADDAVAAPSNGFQLLGQLFDYNDTVSSTDATKNLVAFFRKAITGPLWTTGMRLFGPGGAADLLVSQYAHLFFGGDADLGVTSELTGGGYRSLNVVRNSDPTNPFRRTCDDGGNQNNFSEGAKKAIDLVGDLKLIGVDGKFVQRSLPLGMAHTAFNNTGAHEWNLTNVFLGAGIAPTFWCPIDPAGIGAGIPESRLYYGIDAIAGRKLVEIVAFGSSLGGAGHKIFAFPAKYTPGGTEVALGPTVEWDNETAWKTIALTAEETYAADTHYYVKFWVEAATYPLGTDAGIGVLSVKERFFELQ